MRALASDLRLAAGRHGTSSTGGLATAAGGRPRWSTWQRDRHLAQIDAPLDLERVTSLGHSSGGHLALWAAGREQLPAGAPGALDGLPSAGARESSRMPASAISPAPTAGWHGGAVRALMGGSPEQLPERYDVADPMARVPLSMPVLLVHGGARRDRVGQAQPQLRDAPRVAAGAAVELVEIEGEAGRHRAFIDPRGEAWLAVAGRLAAPARDGRESAAPGAARRRRSARAPPAGARRSRRRPSRRRRARGPRPSRRCPDAPRACRRRSSKERRAHDRARLARFGRVVEVGVACP